MQNHGSTTPATIPDGWGAVGCGSLQTWSVGPISENSSPPELARFHVCGSVPCGELLTRFTRMSGVRRRVAAAAERSESGSLAAADPRRRPRRADTRAVAGVFTIARPKALPGHVCSLLQPRTALNPHSHYHMGH